MFLTKRKVPQTGAEIPFRCRGGQYTVTFQRVFPGGGTRKLQMTPPPHPATEFCHLFHMQITPPPPPTTEFCHLFHMQRRNNSFLKYTEEQKYLGIFWNPCRRHCFRSRKEDMSGQKRTPGHPNIETTQKLKI